MLYFVWRIGIKTELPPLRSEIEGLIARLEKEK